MSSAQCLPASSLLKALNVSHVDLFILDVESVEEKILDIFPYNEITVDIWVIEHSGDNEDQNFVRDMVRRGYYYLDMLCDYVADYIFIRKESKLFKKLKVPKRFENRTEVCLFKNETFRNGKPQSFDMRVVRDQHHYPELKFRNVKVHTLPNL